MKKKSSKGKIIILIIVAVLAMGLVGRGIALIVENKGSSAGAGKVDVVDKNTTDEILSKTVMVYLDGADLEENYESSTNAIYDIINSGVDTQKHNILIYTGGCNLWHGYGIPADKDCIYQVKDNTLNLLTTYEPRNMGDPNTLSAFMEYCVENYPAQQYGVLFDNHGGGPNHGACFDHRNNNDSLSMYELQQAFSDAGFGRKSKMEFVIFELCLMGSIETAHSIKDYANYMVASENVSYTYGSDYSFISAIDQSNSGADIGRAYVDKFYAKSARLASGFDNPYDVTYSCIDLSKVSAVEDSMDNLFKKINSNMDSIQSDVYNGMINARAVKEGADSYSRYTNAEYSLIDLLDWASYFEHAYPTETSELKNAVSNMVTYNRSTTPRMHGITVYCPYSTNGPQYDYDSFGFSKEYTKFVNGCYERATNSYNSQVWSTTSDVVYSAVSDCIGNMSFKLTDEQAENFAKGEYYLLAKYSGLTDYEFEKDEFAIVSGGNDVVLSSDNTLKATYDNRVLYAQQDGKKVPVVSTLYRYKNADDEVFYNMYCGLQYVPDVADYPGDEKDEQEREINALAWSIENMRLDVSKLTLKEDNGKVSVVCGEPVADDDKITNAGVLLPVESYNEYEFFSFINKVKYGKDSKPLLLNQWEEQTDKKLSSMFEVKKTTLSMDEPHEDVEYFAVFVIEDIYGNKYCTDIKPVK